MKWSSIVRGKIFPYPLVISIDKIIKTFHQNECNFKFDRKDAGWRWTSICMQARKLSLSKTCYFCMKNLILLQIAIIPNGSKVKFLFEKAQKYLIWKKQTFCWATKQITDGSWGVELRQKETVLNNILNRFLITSFASKFKLQIDKKVTIFCRFTHNSINSSTQKNSQHLSNILSWFDNKFAIT